MHRYFHPQAFHQRLAATPPTYEPIPQQAAPNLRLLLQAPRAPCRCGNAQRRTYIGWLYAGYKVRAGERTIEKRMGADGKPIAYFCACQVEIKN